MPPPRRSLGKHLSFVERQSLSTRKAAKPLLNEGGRLLVAGERSTLNERNDITEFDVFTGFRRSFKEFNHTLCHLFPKRNPVRNTDQIGVFEFNSGALVAIVQQSIETGAL